MSGPEEDLRKFYASEMRDRAVRPLGVDRTARVSAFAEEVCAARAAKVLEVGCGAGRDGLLLGKSGCAYAGVDVSPEAVQICRERGLNALEASATNLPFVGDSFDAAWSMSTLMHLPGRGFDQAISELGRVIRPGGLLAIGVWGHTSSRVWTKDDGRYFRHRSDAELQQALRVLGDVVGFETWDWYEDGGHYQFARVLAR